MTKLTKIKQVKSGTILIETNMANVKTRNICKQGNVADSKFYTVARNWNCLIKLSFEFLTCHINKWCIYNFYVAKHSFSSDAARDIPSIC